MSTSRLEGRRILITGAASGIGLATAELFAQEGAKLALIDRSETVAEVAERLGATHAICNVSRPEQVADAIAQADASLGGLDGLVNAAGLLRRGAFKDFPLAEWKAVMDVNLAGTMLVCHSILPVFERESSATIVNIASVAALKPANFAAIYSVSKAGVLMFGRCLALELGPKIRVNTICPGTIETPMTTELLSNNAVVDRLTNAAAAKRFGTPEEVAQSILYLTGDESSYVNGAGLTVDGGFVYH